MNWYVEINKIQVGPLSEQQVRARLVKGEIGLNTLVWREGMMNWIPLKLSELVAAPQASATNRQPGEPPVTELSMWALYIRALKKYGSFEGRASRREYWYFVLANFLVGFGLAFALAFASVLLKAPSLMSLGNLYQLAVLLPSIALGIRRMHDTNHSGWSLFCPVYNLILLVSDGTPGDNGFGPDPKGRGMSDSTECLRRAA